MFTLEYSYWFDYMRPGLDALRLPIPLGGTSNHFLLSRLRTLGGWDPFNVTEDADLGIRATCEGYTVGVIRSTTFEEANRAGKNWIRQRSRWIKGYMQTWLVHNRTPLRLLREIGLRRWLSYQFFIGGTCFTFLANPILWLFYIFSVVAHPAWTARLVGGRAVLLTLFCLIVGNLVGIYQGLIAVFRRKLFHLAPFALTCPLYWWMHSIASYMALWQLVTKPFYWEKTVHGLTSVDAHKVLKPGGVLGT
jgi:cellulose synthase/poly-beta-1,6-N-acetylglucosamine synthase-like glycosyltransferase